MRLLMMLFGCLVAVTARAETEELKAELVSEVSTAVSGQTFLVGLHFQHPPGTHTYWKFPGIVGLATRVEWSLPEGVKVGELQWPAPEKVMMARYATQGYEGQVLLMAEVTVPADCQAENLTLSARVSWMHCGKTCHPVNDRPFSITIPVGPVKANSPAAPLFAKFQALVPRTEPLWKTSVKREGNWIHLKLESADPEKTRPASDLGDIRFFTEDGQVDSDQPQEIERLENGSIRLKLAVAESAPKEAKTLPGVVVSGQGWRKEGGPKAMVIRPAY